MSPACFFFSDMRQNISTATFFVKLRFLMISIPIGFYSNNYDFVPLPLPSPVDSPETVPRYGPLPIFLKGYVPLPFVTDREINVTCVTERYMRYRPLHNVTDRNITLQTVR